MGSNDSKLVNAWIYMGQEDPVIDGQPVGYNDPRSSYQALIKNNVYQAVDILSICFVNTVPTGADTIPTGDGSSYTVTLAMGVDHDGHHPDGMTNQDYMGFIIRDSRIDNPGLRILVTLLWGEDDVLSRIFSNKDVSDEENADNFASNIVAYLKKMELDGFDIDWERNMYGPITQPQVELLFNAIGNGFRKQTGKHYYFTISPAETVKLESSFVNDNVDLINLQLYYDQGLKDEFTGMGVNEDLLAYGASFESGTTAQDAFSGYKEGSYSTIINWRLNSGNFDFEQSNQKELYQMVHGPRQ